MPDGTVSARVETFSQDTGRIIRVLTKSESQDDFIALGVAGSVGLVEHEQVIDLFHVRRTFATINPLANNMINGRWTPPINRNQIVNQVKPALDGSSECRGLRPERQHEREPGRLQLQSR